MTQIDNNDVGDSSVRNLRTAARLLAEGIEEAERIPETAFHDPVLARRYWRQMLEENKALHRMLARTLRQLDRYEHPLPPEIQEAIDTPTPHARDDYQTVTATLGGIERTIAVPADNLHDPAATNAWWDRVQARYGGSSR